MDAPLSTLFLLLAAFAPPLLLLWLVYRTDRWDPEQRGPLLTALLLGVGLSLPALYLEQAIAGELQATRGLLRLALLAFVAVALVEEGLKWLTLLVYPYRQSFFTEPIDGIVYAAAIAMGLAAVENLWYALQYGWATTVFRALTAVPAHAIFAIFQGYYIGRARFEPERRHALLWRGLLLAWALHGIYNLLFSLEAYKWLLLLAAPAMGLTAWLARDLLRRHQQDSERRHRSA